jgi:hypothetical protein
VSNPSALGAICWEAEAAWGEDVTTFATDRVAVIGAVDASGLTHDKLAPDRVVQYLNDGTSYINGVMGGSFKTKVYLTGHGSTMVGSPTIGAHENFLALVFGSAAALSATASTTLTGGTAAVPTTTASATFSAGGLCRIGTLGDAKGDGQFYAVTTHLTTSLTLRGAMRAAPVATNVLYPVVQIFGPESPTATAVTGTRFLLQTANLQYECHGCFPMSVAIAGLNAGEVPTAEITWGVSWWRYSTATFPSAVTSTAVAFNPGAVAAGSLNVQDVGTTTRNERLLCRSVSLEYTLGIEVLKGPGGINQYQAIIGARRTPNTIMLTVTEEADAATTSPVLPGYGIGTTFKHIEYTASTADGSAFGFAMPRACVTNIATQKADQNLNRLTTSYRAHTSAVTTSNLTLAALVLGFA